MKDWQNKTILIVEDDVVSYNLLKFILKKTGAKLLWGQNGQEGVNLYSDNKNIDIVLMDIQMPVMDGYEATFKIKEQKVDVPIIIVSAYSEQEVIAKAKSKGADGFVPKPVQINKLLQIIEDHLN